MNELTGIKESDTGLAPPALWDLAADKQTLQNEQPLQVSNFVTVFCVLYVKLCERYNRLTVACRKGHQGRVSPKFLVGTCRARFADLFLLVNQYPVCIPR